MSASDEYSALIFGQVMELKKLCGSIFHKNIRDCVTETEIYFKNLPKSNEEINLKTALKPFFLAMKDEKKTFQNIVLDTFYKVFHQASEKKYPDNDLTLDIFKVLVDTELQANDDLNLKVCNMCIACLKSPSGIRYVHGHLLEKMFILLFKMYDTTFNPSAYKTMETAIKPIIKALFENYDEQFKLSEKFNSSEEISAAIIDYLVAQSFEILDFLEPVIKTGDFSGTIRDVDVYVMFTVLANLIENNTIKIRTKVLVTKFITLALKEESNFYKTSIFAHLLNTKLHVAFLALSINQTMDLAIPTAKLILVLWERFAPVYSIGLNEILIKGLLTTLISPDPSVLKRTLKVLEILTKQPQLFVDCFVNYDCDESGFFQNVFENLFSQIVKMSYPSTPQTEIQKESLSLVVKMLKCLWDYYDKLQSEASTQNQLTSTAPDAPQSFLDAKKAKDVFTEGLQVFKRSFKKGLAFFTQHNIVEDNPKAIAKFLYTTPALDPAMVGECIGSSGERSISILKEFTALFDFKGLTFEQSFRQFLSKFQIPGEAQMIDRVMEQFGTKFYNDNPTLFSSAETVYVLAFSTLMLHTDAWHPNVKSRMTLDQFVENNKGIDGGHDLPYTLLEELYKGITTTRIFLPNAATPNSALLTRAQRADLYRSRCAATIAQAKQRNEAQERKWHRSESPLYIGPMFTVVWHGALAVLTITFETIQEPEIYKLCLNGLALMVHIASHCFVENALDTLVDSFAKFTNLRKGLSDVKAKNIDCTNSLLQIAMDDRHFLRGAWDIVMGEISALDKLKERGDELPTTINQDLIDDLFVESASLDRESLVDFVKALCTTSKLELSEKVPRIYSLQKITIVATYNVKRPRFIWMAVWEEIGNHLKYVGSSHNQEIAEIAIDLTRQLSSKFLMEEELAALHFQQHFLAPFQSIYDNQHNTTVRELVLRCLSHLISEQSPQLQSGWLVIFNVLTSSSASTDTCNLGFSVVEQLINTQISVLDSQLLYIISVLCSFVASADDDKIKAKASELFGPVSRRIKSDDRDTWFALLQALSRYANDKCKDVRGAIRGAILETFAHIAEANDPEVWKEALVHTAPEFFVFNSHSTEDDDELSQFIQDIIAFAPESQQNSVITLLMKLVLSTDGISSVCISKLVALPYPLNDDSNEAIRESLKNLESKFDKIQLENQIAFLSLCELIIEKDKEHLSQAVYDFILHIFECVTKVETKTEVPQPHQEESANAETPPQKGEGHNEYSPILPYIRTSLLKATKVIKGDNECRGVVNDTFSLYQQYVLSRNSNENNDSKAWDLCAKGALDFIMDSDNFEETFKLSQNYIVELIASNSLIVRKSVSKLLKKKFLNISA